MKYPKMNWYDEGVNYSGEEWRRLADESTKRIEAMLDRQNGVVRTYWMRYLENWSPPINSRPS